MNVTNGPFSTPRSNVSTSATSSSTAAASKRGYADASTFESKKVVPFVLPQPAPAPVAPAKPSALRKAGRVVLFGAGALAVGAATVGGMAIAGLAGTAGLLRAAGTFVVREGFRDLAMQLTSLFVGVVAGGVATAVVTGTAVHAATKSSRPEPAPLVAKAPNPYLHPFQALKYASARYEATYRAGVLAYDAAPSTLAALGSAVKTGATLGAQAGRGVGGFAGTLQGAATGGSVGGMVGVFSGPASVALSIGAAAALGVAGNVVGKAAGAIAGCLVGGVLGGITGLAFAAFRRRRS